MSLYLRCVPCGKDVDESDGCGSDSREGLHRDAKRERISQPASNSDGGCVLFRPDAQGSHRNPTENYRDEFLGEYGTPATLQKGERVYPGDAQAAQTLRGFDGAGGSKDAEAGRESECGLGC